jgi:hypothetical protein
MKMLNYREEQRFHNLLVDVSIHASMFKPVLLCFLYQQSFERRIPTIDNPWHPAKGQGQVPYHRQSSPLTRWCRRLRFQSQYQDLRWSACASLSASIRLLHWVFIPSYPYLKIKRSSFDSGCTALHSGVGAIRNENT